MRLVIIVIMILFLSFFVHASNFVSIKSNKANLRIGPSVDYPIEWVYIQKNIPVEVLEQYEQWYKIKDIDGTTGWMHKSLLSNKRYFIVIKTTLIYTNPRKTSKIRAYVDPRVIGKLINCENEWCKVQVQDINGWMIKDYIWGI